MHERGARHMIDPSRLVASAQRIYGDDFDRLWGEVVPVPEERMRILTGGERLDGFRVEYTPGHASHHVAYLHEATGTAFTGDVAGVRIGDGPILPPTPPPDIDVELWLASIDIVEAWKPERLAVTHFGAHDARGPPRRAARAPASVGGQGARAGRGGLRSLGTRGDGGRCQLPGRDAARHALRRA